MIWSGGTPSSKSNDRTKANKIAFILIIIFPRTEIGERVDSDEKSSLSNSESVTYARVRASDERQQITKNTRDSFDGFWNRFPTFWSVNGQAQF